MDSVEISLTISDASESSIHSIELMFRTVKCICNIISNVIEGIHLVAFSQR